MGQEVKEGETQSTPERYGEGAYTQEEAEYGQARATEELREVNRQIHGAGSTAVEKRAAKKERGKLILRLDYYRKALFDIMNKVQFKKE